MIIKKMLKVYNYKVYEKGIKESLAEISKISGDTDVLDKVEKYYDEVKKLIGA